MRKGRIRFLNRYLILSLIGLVDQYTRDMTSAFIRWYQILEAKDLEFEP